MKDVTQMTVEELKAEYAEIEYQLSQVDALWARRNELNEEIRQRAVDAFVAANGGASVRKGDKVLVTPEYQEWRRAVDAKTNDPGRNMPPIGTELEVFGVGTHRTFLLYGGWQLPTALDIVQGMRQAWLDKQEK